MMINGVYEKSNHPATEQTVNTVVKEETDTAAVKDTPAADFEPAPGDAGYNTYTENNMQKDMEETQEKASDEDGMEDSTSGRMTKEDYKDISKEGISLEKFDKERLARVLNRIKSQRIVKEENLTTERENLKNKSDDIEKMAGYSAATKKIVKRLEESGLPVTKANIARIATAMELAADARNLSDKAISYLIKNKLTPSIENLYKAQYSGNYAGSNNMPDQVFLSLQGQVSQIIDNAGLPVNEETIKSAKWLLNNSLPLTEDNLWAYQDLCRLQENMNEDTVLDRAVKAYASGKNPKAASLGVVDTDRVVKAIENFSSISEEAVKEAVKTHETGRINGRLLQKVMRQLEMPEKRTEKTDTEINEPEKPVKGGELTEIDIKTVTVRRHLEEIRLKMTLEAGRQLMKNGFNLDTDSLSKIVEGLKDLEDKYYNNLLKEGRAEVSPENAELLKKSIDGINELKEMPTYILGSTLSTRGVETVESLLSVGSASKNVLDKAGEVYESLMTKPRSDLGDSISKAFQNVDDILEDMKLEPTQANERAVRILGYNKMAVTDENIRQVKVYDEQVNRLMKNLWPSVTVELIKKDINPINTPIEELNRQIDEIQREIGSTEEEKYSKYLWKLEKNRDISQEDKKSYIGIYRLLNTVDKSDGAALGAVLKAEREVNLNNLLTAVRTMRSGGMDMAVDDSFGSLSRFNKKGESITDQLNASFSHENKALKNTEEEKSEKVRYMEHLIKDVKEELSPEKLKVLGNPNEIMSLPVEKLKDLFSSGLESTEADGAYWDQKLEEYHEITNQSDQARKVLENFDIPETLPNILAAKDLLSSDRSFYKQLKNLLKENKGTADTGNDIGNTNEFRDDLADISEDLVNAFTDKEGLVEQYQDLSENVDKILDQIMDNPVITSKDVATLQRIRYGMSFIHNMASRESYEIPLAVGDNITNVNVTILKNTGISGKVNLHADSENLGNIMVSLSVKEKGVNALITCENKEGLEILKEKNQGLAEALSGSDLKIKQLNYGIGNKKSDSYRYTNYNPDKGIQKGDTDTDQISTDTLYHLAKIFLVNIKNAEYDSVKR